MEFKAAGNTDVGRLREANEDSFLIDPKRKLYIVADGMGGHQGGGFASKKILELVTSELDRLESMQEVTQPIQTRGRKDHHPIPAAPRAPAGQPGTV